MSPQCSRHASRTRSECPPQECQNHAQFDRHEPLIVRQREGFQPELPYRAFPLDMAGDQLAAVRTEEERAVGSRDAVNSWQAFVLAEPMWRILGAAQAVGKLESTRRARVFPETPGQRRGEEGHAAFGSQMSGQESRGVPRRLLQRWVVEMEGRSACCVRLFARYGRRFRTETARVVAAGRRNEPWCLGDPLPQWNRPAAPSSPMGSETLDDRSFWDQRQPARDMFSAVLFNRLSFSFL
jgi:hypothetical protein